MWRWLAFYTSYLEVTNNLMEKRIIILPKHLQPMPIRGCTSRVSWRNPSKDEGAHHHLQDIFPSSHLRRENTRHWYLEAISNGTEFVQKITWAKLSEIRCQVWCMRMMEGSQELSLNHIQIWWLLPIMWWFRLILGIRWMWSHSCWIIRLCRRYQY